MNKLNIECAFSYASTSAGNAQIFFNINNRIKEIVDNKYLNKEKRELTARVLETFISEVEYCEKNVSCYKPIARPDKEEIQRASSRTAE